MTTTAMLHEIDPRVDLQNRIGNIEDIEIFHNQILVATYIRPEKTLGGLILPNSTRDEDKYQGKVGLVIAKGPEAFVDDTITQFRGQNVNIGDWIFYRMSDGWQFTIKGNPTRDNPKGEWHCRMLIDRDIKGKIPHPDRLI
jgi:co-chaperonin GroES (HSP10)